MYLIEFISALRRSVLSNLCSILYELDIGSPQMAKASISIKRVADTIFALMGRLGEAASYSYTADR